MKYIILSTLVLSIFGISARAEDQLNSQISENMFTTEYVEMIRDNNKEKMALSEKRQKEHEKLLRRIDRIHARD